MSNLDLQQILQMIVGAVSGWGLKVLSAIVLFAVGRTIAGWARRATEAALRRAKIDETLVPFVSSLAYYAVLVFVLVAVLGAVGIQTASIVAVLGAAGLAVGFALQGTLSQFAAGVMLLIFRPFKRGDFVEAGGVAGSIESIGIFVTILNTPDNVRIIVPNASVWGQTIKNYASNPTRRVDMVVGISYNDDIGIAMDAIARAMKEDDRVLRDPEPTIAVSELADSSVNLVVRPWCRREDYGSLKCDLTRRFKEELEGAGCSIPYPQHEVHLRQTSGRAA